MRLESSGLRSRILRFISHFLGQPIQPGSAAIYNLSVRLGAIEGEHQTRRPGSSHLEAHFFTSDKFCNLWRHECASSTYPKTWKLKARTGAQKVRKPRKHVVLRKFPLIGGIMQVLGLENGFFMHCIDKNQKQTTFIFAVASSDAKHHVGPSTAIQDAPFKSVNQYFKELAYPPPMVTGFHNKNQIYIVDFVPQIEIYTPMFLLWPNYCFQFRPAVLVIHLPRRTIQVCSQWKTGCPYSSRDVLSGIPLVYVNYI